MAAGLEEQQIYEPQQIKKRALAVFSQTFVLIQAISAILLAIACFGLFLSANSLELARKTDLYILYSFVSSPSSVSMNFLGFFDITSKSIVLALTAGILQYINVRFAMPKPPARDPDAAPSFKADFSRNMHMQMLYVMPVIIVMTAYALGSTIALYFVVSNIMTIAQEYFVKKHR